MSHSFVPVAHFDVKLGIMERLIKSFANIHEGANKGVVSCPVSLVLGPVQPGALGSHSAAMGCDVIEDRIRIRTMMPQINKLWAGSG